MTQTPPAHAAEARVAGLDWPSIEDSLNSRGSARIERFLSAEECVQLRELYAQSRLFRSRIDMARYRFGSGEYQYFAAPLPALVQGLREHFYSPLAVIANRWANLLESNYLFPPSLGRFLEHCHAHQQMKPTPLLLRYSEGDYNCLHQDLYGEVAFPLQVALLLSAPHAEFTGGEFLLFEQRPRAQSRGYAISLEQGDAIIFANRYFPVKGSRGYYRATFRHGVSTVTSGTRHCLGIIFHDAK